MISQQFGKYHGTQLANRVSAIRTFHNPYIAHQEKQLTDIEQAREELWNCISGLAAIYEARHG